MLAPWSRWRKSNTRYDHWLSSPLGCDLKSKTHYKKQVFGNFPRSRDEMTDVLFRVDKISSSHETRNGQKRFPLTGFHERKKASCVCLFSCWIASSSAFSLFSNIFDLKGATKLRSGLVWTRWMELCNPVATKASIYSEQDACWVEGSIEHSGVNDWKVSMSDETQILT